MLNKEQKDLLGRLERIFPYVKIHYEGEVFTTGTDESDFAPPRDLDWSEVIERLGKHGLEITKSNKEIRTKCHCGNQIDFSNPDCVTYSLCKDCAMDS
jgi:hypothetical protein